MPRLPKNGPSEKTVNESKAETEKKPNSQNRCFFLSGTLLSFFFVRFERWAKRIGSKSRPAAQGTRQQAARHAGGQQLSAAAARTGRQMRRQQFSCHESES